MEQSSSRVAAIKSKFAIALEVASILEESLLITDLNPFPHLFLQEHSLIDDTNELTHRYM